MLENRVMNRRRDAYGFAQLSDYIRYSRFKFKFLFQLYCPSLSFKDLSHLYSLILTHSQDSVALISVIARKVSLFDSVVPILYMREQKKRYGIFLQVLAVILHAYSTFSLVLTISWLDGSMPFHSSLRMIRFSYVCSLVPPQMMKMVRIRQYCYYGWERKVDELW